VVADFDHDGHMDLAYALEGRGVEVLMGMGGCQFRPITEYPFAGRVTDNLVYADLNGDGIGDLVAATDGGNIYLLLGAGDGTFQVTLLRSNSPTGAAISVGDVTGDGKPDLVTAGGLSSTNLIPQPIQIVENTCP
jgi:hypothetical protein